MTTSRHDEATEAKLSSDEAFGRAVHMAMFDRRWTQTRLGREAKIQQSLVSKKLRGLRPWTLDEMVRVADALRVDLRDLLGSMWADPGTPSSQSGADLTVSYTGLYLASSSPTVELSDRTTGHLAVAAGQ